MKRSLIISFIIIILSVAFVSCADFTRDDAKELVFNEVKNMVP